MDLYLSFVSRTFWTHESSESIKMEHGTYSDDLDNDVIVPQYDHDLEGFGFTYLWWINMMLSRD